MNNKKVMTYIQNYLEEMPFYVLEYYRSKTVEGRSPNTMYEYLKEYKRFFTWIIESDVATVDTIKDIPLTILEELTKKDLEAFFSYLQERSLLNQSTTSTTRTLSNTTVRRTQIALSSLFNYLTIESENENGQPYFDRNVMKKVKIKKTGQTLQTRAARIKPQLFLGDETQQYLDHIEFVYPNKVSKRALVSYELNKERDLAVNALFLGTGIRLSELINANVSDLDLDNMTIQVVRKGGEVDVVNIAPFSHRYLSEYLEIREKRYKLDDLKKSASKSTDESVEALRDAKKALFVSINKGITERLLEAGIERMVAKYSASFKVRVTPHKLRHTLATRVYDATKDPILVAQQLGHTNNNTQSVATYAHVLHDETKSALKGL